MKTEAETEIAGEEFSKRMKEYHGMVTESSLFQWAQTKPDSHTKEDEDPISKLLHSNTKIFEKTD
jgi:hypothetical protein